MKRLSTVLILMAAAAAMFAGGSGEQPSQASATPVNKTGLPFSEETLRYSITARIDASSPVSWEEKITVNAMLEETNLSVEWEEIPAAGWAEKVSLIFASRDIPDALWGGVDSLTLLQNREALLPLNDLIDEWAPSLRGFLDVRADIEQAITTPDGNIYGFFQLSEYIDDLIRPHLLVNQTWLDATGLEIPGTTTEFRAMLEAFKSYDANGNGEADEIPFSFAFDGDPAHSLYPMFGSFGVPENENHLMVEDGQVLFTGAQDGYFEALEYFSGLFADGLLDSSGFAQTKAQYTSKSTAGEPIYGTAMAIVAEQVVQPQYAPDYVAIPPLAGPDGDRLWWVTDVVPVGLKKDLVVLNRDVEVPEGLVRFVDYIASEERQTLRWSYGEEGQGWEYRDDGRIIHKLEENTPEGMSYGVFVRMFRGVGPFIKDYCVNRRLGNTEANIRRDEHIRKYMPFIPEQFVTTTAYEEPDLLAERASILTDIRTYMQGFVARSVTEGITEAQWQAHLSNLDRLRVDRYLELMQDYYSRNQLESGAQLTDDMCPSPVSIF